MSKKKIIVLVIIIAVIAIFAYTASTIDFHQMFGESSAVETTTENK